MPTITLDLHILKKVLTNQQKIETTMKKMTVLFMELEKRFSENVALLEFIESVCSENKEK